MKILSKAANLSKIYTNHSLRATAITLWSDAGLSNRHIMSLSGHRNETSLRSYNTRPSSQQLQLCSNVLSTALNSADQHLLPQKVTQQPDLTSGIAACTIPTQNIYSRHDEKVSFAAMFSGCQIGQVHIHRHDKPKWLWLQVIEIVTFWKHMFCRFFSRNFNWTFDSWCKFRNEL